MRGSPRTRRAIGGRRATRGGKRPPVLEMSVRQIRRGLQLPLQGAPDLTVDEGPELTTVALLGDDSIGLRPRLAVAVGDAVARGQLLYEDKAARGVRYTAPAAGRVVAIHRGEKRRLVSVVVELSPAERDGDQAHVAHVELAAFRSVHPRDLATHEVEALLLESGLWTALRARPFSRVADPAHPAAAIFVNAMDSQPHAPPMRPVLEDRAEHVEYGLHALAKLTGGPVFVCTDPDTPLPMPHGARFVHERFAGPHPAGVVGTHIHHLFPVGRGRRIWHIGIQDVLAIGHLLQHGRLDVTRIVSLAGPGAVRPRLLRTRLGANLRQLCNGEARPGAVRRISGSVLAGRTAEQDAEAFLGRYHQQVSLLPEHREREFLGWLSPAPSSRPVAPTPIARWLRRLPIRFHSGRHGSPRAIVPLELYERVLPLDLEPAFLLKALAVEDVEWAESLGCLELDEEDLALCAYVCPSKADFGTQLRKVLTTIDSEGA